MPRSRDSPSGFMSDPGGQSREQAAREGRPSDVPAENIRDWRDHNVVDVEGSKIGSLEAVYYDTATDEATFATVKVGMLGRQRLVFVPLAGAVVSPKYLKVNAHKKLVKESPAIAPDGELTSAEEPAVFEHYGLIYQPGQDNERRLGRR